SVRVFLKRQSTGLFPGRCVSCRKRVPRAGRAGVHAHPRGIASATASGVAETLVDAASQPFEFVFNSEFFFFEGLDTNLIPFGVRHFGVDRVFELLMFFGKFLDMPLLKRHAKPLHLGLIIREPSPPLSHAPLPRMLAEA